MRIRGKQLLPWYAILWNLIWVIPLCLTHALLCFVLLLASGTRSAKQIWKEFY